MHHFMKGEGLGQRSQDLPSAYVVNGAFYLISPKDLRNQKSFYGDNMVPLVIEASEETIDIDTVRDWELAETFIKSNVLFPMDKGQR